MVKVRPRGHYGHQKNNNDGGGGEEDEEARVGQQQEVAVVKGDEIDFQQLQEVIREVGNWEDLRDGAGAGGGGCECEVSTVD